MAYKPNEKLTLTLDGSYTLWSRLKNITINMEGAAPPAYDSTDNVMLIKTEWENIFRVSIGGEYHALKPLWIRGGFYLDPSPIPDETFSPLFMDIGSKYSANIGCAFDISSWQIGYNFEYIHFAERDVTAGAIGDIGFDNYPGVFKSYLIANHLSVTYRF